MTQRPPDGDLAGPAPGPDEISSAEELRAAVVRMLGTSDDRAVERRVGVSKTTVNDLRNGRRRLTLKSLTLIAEAYDPARRDAWLAAWHRLHPRPTPAVSSPGAPAPAPAAPAATLPAAGPPASGAVAPGVPGPADVAAGSVGPPDSDVPADQASLAGTDSTGLINSAEPLDTNIPDIPDIPDGPDDVARPAGSAESGVPGLSWRAARVLAGSALLAAVAAVAAMVFVLTGGDSTVALESGGVEQALPASGGGPGLLPDRPYGPGGPGAPAPVGGPGPPPVPGMPPGALGAGGGADAGGDADLRGGRTSPAPGCYALPLPTTAEVVDGPGSRPAGIRITEASYHYFAAWSPSVALGGRLSSGPADGRILVSASWADPATRDSTSEQNPGSGRYFPGQPLELTEQNCFTVQPYNIGYGGYTGITTRVYLMLVDPGELPALPREAHQRAGLTDDDLADHRVDILGYFTIPSPH